MITPAAVASQFTSPEVSWVVSGAAGILLLAETTAPSATANYGKLYVKSSDSNLYFKDDGGTETALTGGGVGANAALSNLSGVAINTDLILGSSDGGALGSATKMWSDLFLASGAVINFNNGDVTITHSADTLTFAGGTVVLGVATATTYNGMTVTTSSGTFTLTNSKVFSVTQTLTLSGTDSTVMTFPTTSATIARTDAANTFTGASTASAWVLTSPTITTKLNPTSDDGAPLGDTTHNWSDLFLATGAVINYANSNVVITHSSGILTMGTGELRITTIGTNTASVVSVGGTQTLTAKTLTSPVIGTSPTAAGATWTDLGTVTTADINGGTLDGTVIGGASAAAITGTTITGTVITGNSFVPNSTTVPSNGMYLPAANTLGWAANSAIEMQLTSTALSPGADGGSSLGTTALGWQNLFGNTGFVFNIENSDWVATHTAGILTVGTGDLRVTTAGTNSASVVTVGGTQTLTGKSIVVSQLTAGTFAAAIFTMGENTEFAMDAVLSADGKYCGITEVVTAGETIAFGEMVYLKAADSQWYLTDADADSTAGAVRIAIAVTAGTDNNTMTIMTYGKIRADAKFPTLTVGAPAYLSTTGGAVQTAQPSGTDDVVRIVGYGNTGDEMMFCPSDDYMTVV